MNNQKFKILSIDGGGIRGIFPAMILANFEAELKSKGLENWQVYQNFDLICGTSTGGIIALALSLGIPAIDIYNLYFQNATIIFGGKKSLFKSLFSSSHNRQPLEKLIRNKFKCTDTGKDLRLIDCKIPTMIPIYDLLDGQPSVLKSKYHERMRYDFHIPAYQAALATSAAPTFFDPYSASYTDLHGINKPFSNKVDGGVFANNPTLNALIEAQRSFKMELKDLSILSLGTGHQKFRDSGLKRNKGPFNFLLQCFNLQSAYSKNQNFGLHYWLTQESKKRLIELFMQGQTQQTQNLISLLRKGVDQSESSVFEYLRLNTELDENCSVEMDETDINKLKMLEEKAHLTFKQNAGRLLSMFGTGTKWTSQNEN